ncbi:hypothetical protein C8R47DRAFT_1255733 [Mycena vitilis]|nr:hypothetical protein C8R47DRAFT_1255733 [Mycena vitilis]
MRTKRPDLKLRAVWLSCGSERLSFCGSKSAVREARAGVLRVDGSRLGDKIRFSGANQDARDRLEEKGTRQAKSPGSVRAFYLHLLEERYLSIRTVELELDEKRRTYDWDLQELTTQREAWGLQQTRHERTLEDIQGRDTAVVAQKDALQEKHRETLAAFASKNRALVRTVETKQAEFTTLEQRYQALSKHTSASTTQSKSLFKEKLRVVEDQLSAAECSGMQLARQAEIDLAQIRDLELDLEDAVDSERRLRDRMDEKLEAADSALKQVHGPLSEDLEQWGSDISRIAAIRSLSSVSSSLGLTNPMQMSSIKDSGIKSDKLRLPAPSSTVTTPMSCSVLEQLGKTERLKLGLRYANQSATDKDGGSDTQILAVLPKLVEYDLVEPKGWQRLREWRWSRRRRWDGLRWLSRPATFALFFRYGHRVYSKWMGVLGEVGH